MKFDVDIPVRIFPGAGALPERRPAHARQARGYCLWAQGRSTSGALDDVTLLLEATGAQYLIFDKAETRRSRCATRRQSGLSLGADFVIGIGGLGARRGKAVAAFA